MRGRSCIGPKLPGRGSDSGVSSPTAASEKEEAGMLSDHVRHRAPRTRREDRGPKAHEISLARLTFSRVYDFAIHC